ncbi:type II toxin-antitoxin system Phd/YefM family antitoxin [Candidatus Roizmanbacteria bacterium]|nr:type II toxin-antitoxin system Phd/YefM family antitoxin [Candidatus Roizmanbacteria bacterium]
MNTLRISATYARNNFFELLNQVALGREAVIEKDGKEVALLTAKTTKTNWRGLLKASKAVHAILKEEMDENPLRTQKAKKLLGSWDR